MDTSLHSDMSENDKELLLQICKQIDIFFDDLRKFDDIRKIGEVPVNNPFYQILYLEECPIRTSLINYLADVPDIVDIFIKSFKGCLPRKSNQDEVTVDEKSIVEYATYLMVVIGDLMDSYEHVCKNFGEEGALHLILSQLNSEELPDMIAQVAMTCVYNCCRWVPENRLICRGAIDILQRLSTSQNPDIQADAFLTLSYIIEKTESDKITLNESCVKFLLASLAAALENDERRGSGYSVLEITQGIRHLAINDDNKRLIERLGGIPLLEHIILEDGSTDEEKSFASLGIWQLAFIEEIKLKIKERAGLTEGKLTIVTCLITIVPEYTLSEFH